MKVRGHVNGPKNGQFTSGAGGRATPRNNSKPVHGKRDSMPLAPTLVRDFGLQSAISKDLYENYILGGETMCLIKRHLSAQRAMLR